MEMTAQHGKPAAASAHDHHRRRSFVAKAEHALKERLHHMHFLRRVRESMHSLHNLVDIADDAGDNGAEKPRRATGGFRLTAAQEMEELERRVGKHHWRVRLVEAIEQHQVQLALIVLLVVDVLCIVVELFLDAEYPSCAIVKSLVQCCPDTTAAGHGGRLLGGGGAAAGGGSARAQCVSWDACPIGDDDRTLALACEQGHHLHEVHLGLFWTSVSILCIFDIELFALIASYRRLFYRNFMFVFDFVVVNASLILEVYIHIIHHDGDESNDATYGILIFVRCWRFVRIGHGIFESTEKHETKVQDKIKEQVRELKRHVAELEARMMPLNKSTSNATDDGTAASAKEQRRRSPQQIEVRVPAVVIQAVI